MEDSVEKTVTGLSSGRLIISVRRSETSIGELLVVGERLNTKRPFIFVSKVLGKHWPTTPELMGWTHDRLATLLGRLTRPVLFLAMAETAIGLGRGVFESWTDYFPLSEVLYLQTTRYVLSNPVALRFQELHSHASEYLVHLPETEEGREIFYSARSLVVIDDEVSTGRTLVNLALAYQRVNQGLESIHLVCSTNWLSEELARAVSTEVGLEIRVVSLLDGSFSFEPNEGASEAKAVFKSVGDWRPMDEQLTTNFGRLGLSPSLSRANSARAATLADRLELPENQPVLVLETGKFLHEPFSLARRLATRDRRVYFQSTTRTPMPLSQAVGRMLEFKDNYGENIDNFLYNAPNDFPCPIFIICETGEGFLEKSLAKSLRAKVIHL
jgi:hypothetical protein